MATIGDPFVLSSYSQSKRNAKAGPSGLSNVFASNQYASSSSSDGYATVAAQGDGVHVLDLSTLHPAISYTLGPQVHFSCPPATRTTTANESKICTTYAVIESASEVPEDARGKTVWRWRDDPAGNATPAEAQKRRISAVVPHKVSRVYAPDELASHVLLVGPGSEVTLAGEDLVVKNTSKPDDEESLLGSTVMSRQACSFVHDEAAPLRSVLVTIGQKGSSVRVRVIGVEGSGDHHVLGSSTASIPAAQSILDVTCSNTGYISILTSNGTWHSYELVFADQTTLTMSSLSNSITLGSLSFISTASQPTNQPVLSQQEVSVASVGSSHVLLCGFSSGKQSDANEVVILLWDLRYSVILASQTYPAPSSLGRSKKAPAEIQLVVGSPIPSQATVIISPNPQPANAQRSSGDPGARSTVLVVPLTVPPTSQLTNAIGRASASARWFAQTSTLYAESHDRSHAKVLHNLRVQLDQKNVNAAEEAFASWVKEEDAKLPQAPEGAPKNEVRLGHKFVQDVLELVLRPAKSSDAALHSPEIVKYLLRRRAVSSSMIEGGLLPALRLRNDWESIIFALKTVIDISENDLTIFVRDVISTHAASRSSGQSDDSMQVDSTSTSPIPTLPAALALCVTYPMSAPAMRLAIRKHLRDADALVSVLEILLGWVESWCGEEPKFFPQGARNDGRGFFVPVMEDRKRDDLPPLAKVLTFVQILLDSSFLTLLSHSPSHQLIRRIMACLQPELDLNGEIEQLQGPLQPFTSAMPQPQSYSDANVAQKVLSPNDLNKSTPSEDSDSLHTSSPSPAPQYEIFPRDGPCPPIEICELIMGFVVKYHPLAAYVNNRWSQNLSDICRLCLVCRRWVERARYLLYFWVAIDRESQFVKFLSVLNLRPSNGSYTRYLDVRQEEQPDHWLSAVPRELSHRLANLEILQVSRFRPTHVHPTFCKSLILFKHIKAILADGPVAAGGPGFLSHCLRLALVHPNIQHIAICNVNEGPDSLPFGGQRPGQSLTSVTLVLQPSLKLGRAFQVLAPCAAQLTRFTLWFYTPVPTGPPTSEFMPNLRSLQRFLSNAQSLQELKISLYAIEDITISTYADSSTY
ncbi:hypothetical protein EIP91_005360 [Steccherinum ochraceum]|uniref:Utp8 C-terminal domain-containing protein n=1 Tax=Steccherinum ochraceum TaxID=92696 RepID=A0A4R0RI89_9APHY|nr:hypothetical protein EIP91_005360 [Steccherinum ochraceum]